MSSIKHPKATFTVENTGNKRVFHPVNKRAHTVAKKAGKRANVTVSDLKKLKGSGTYKYYQYTQVGADKYAKLTAVRV